MKALILFTTVFFAGIASAKTLKPDWSLKDSKLTYHVTYTLKTVEGVSGAAKGKGHCEKGTCQFLIAVPIKTFLSGDGNRDNHMLEVTKGAMHPMITVALSFPEPLNDPKRSDAILAKAEINFAGKAKTYDQIKIAPKFGEGDARTTGTIPLVLSDFEVERPSLLAIKIDDAVPVDFDITWN